MKKYERRILSIFICNIIDVIATLGLYSTGIFYEVNPIMRCLIKFPIAFIIFKITIVSVALLKLWEEKDDRVAQIAINICWIIYLLLAIYYVVNCALYFMVLRV